MAAKEPGKRILYVVENDTFEWAKIQIYRAEDMHFILNNLDST
jgi:hypothetical protein